MLAISAGEIVLPENPCRQRCFTCFLGVMVEASYFDYSDSVAGMRIDLRQIL
jgi:hypothetical protein